MEISKQRAMCEFALALNKHDLETGDISKARVKEYKYDLLTPLLDYDINFFTFQVGTYRLFNFSQKLSLVDSKTIKTSGGLFETKQALRVEEENEKTLYNPSKPPVEFYFIDFEAIQTTSINTINQYIRSILPCFSYLNSIIDKIEINLVQTRLDDRINIKAQYSMPIINFIADNANLNELVIVLGEKSGETCKKTIFEFILNLESALTKLITKLNVVEENNEDLKEIYFIDPVKAQLVSDANFIAKPLLNYSPKEIYLEDNQNLLIVSKKVGEEINTLPSIYRYDNSEENLSSKFLKLYNYISVKVGTALSKL